MGASWAPVAETTLVLRRSNKGRGEVLNSQITVSEQEDKQGRWQFLPYCIATRTEAYSSFDPPLPRGHTDGALPTQGIRGSRRTRTADPGGGTPAHQPARVERADQGARRRACRRVVRAGRDRHEPYGRRTAPAS